MGKSNFEIGVPYKHKELNMMFRCLGYTEIGVAGIGYCMGGSFHIETKKDMGWDLKDSSDWEKLSEEEWKDALADLQKGN